MSEFEDKLNSILNDPQQMGKITRMAKTLMGGDNAEEKHPDNKEEANTIPFMNPDLDFDIGSISKISRILSEVKNQKDDKQALLSAMEPYLSEKRRDKMEKALKLAKFARIARLAFGEMGGGEDV